MISSINKSTTNAYWIKKYHPENRIKLSQTLDFKSIKKNIIS